MYRLKTKIANGLHNVSFVIFQPHLLSTIARAVYQVDSNEAGKLKRELIRQIIT